MIPEATKQCNKKTLFCEKFAKSSEQKWWEGVMERIGWVTKLDYISVVLEKNIKKTEEYVQVLTPDKSLLLFCKIFRIQWIPFNFLLYTTYWIFILSSSKDCEMLPTVY